MAVIVCLPFFVLFLFYVRLLNISCGTNQIDACRFTKKIHLNQVECGVRVVYVSGCTTK